MASLGEPQSDRDRFGLTEDRFKHIVALLVGGVAFLGTMVAALNVDAGARSATADREGRVLLLQSNADETSALLQFSYEKSRVASFFSLIAQNGVETRLSQETGAAFGPADYQQAASRFQQIENDQRTLSALLTPPYFGPSGPDVLQFVVDRQITPTALATEKQAAQSEQANAWGNKQNNYTITITVLAVCVFLFGLAAIVGRGLGYVFVGVGSFIATGAFLATAITLVLPVPAMPAEAIQQYAQGYGHLAYAEAVESNAFHQRAALRADQAIAALSQAIALRGDYAAAYQVRGDAHLVKGQALRLSQGDPAALRSELGLAVADFRRAIDLGRGDQHTYWNLGYALFLSGQYQDALATSQQALKLAPDRELGLGMNMAVYLCAQGKRAEAMQELEETLAWADTHRLGSDAYYMRQIIHVLDQFRQVQPAEGMDQIEKRIKEAFVSLTYRNTAAVKPTGAEIGSLQFEQPTLDSSGSVTAEQPTAQFPRATERVDFTFDYRQMPKAALIVLQVYDGLGNEIPLMTESETWPLGDSGQADWSLRAPIEHTLAGLPSGHYTVEMYVEGELLQSGSFDIE